MRGVDLVRPLALVVAVISGCVCVGLASSAADAASVDQLKSQIDPLVAAHNGRVAVMVKHLDQGVEFRHNADTVMPTASLIKTAVLVAAYRSADAGKVDLTRSIALKQEDKVPGSGVLTSHFTPGAQFILRDAVRLMIAFSDNTATNLVLDQVGLPVPAEMMEQSGLPNTKIHAKVYRGDTSIFPERSKEFGLGSTTAAEMVRLFELIHRKEAASPASCEAMLEHLAACEDHDLLARDLPPGLKFAHKTGAVTAVRTDAGIMYSPGGPVAICVLTADNEDKRWVRDNAAEVLCARIGRVVFDHFNPPSLAGGLPTATRLSVGAEGPIVEALQRTLNARLTPSPDISADGDFGPVTREVVMQFQRDRELPVTGEVGPETWKALGPLVMSDSPVPEPAVLNEQVLPREPADDPTAPPHVTCRAYAVADGQTGRMIGCKNERMKLDIASTTKMMTAYLVFSLAEKDPGVLDERVTFSQRADETSGSSAGLQAGELLSVRELMFGLLLPSGNDAAVAVAEHFGSRFSGEGLDLSADSYVRFISQMNRTAKELGMNDTNYCNPHGMTEPSHRSTAADLVLLTVACRKLPLFHQYVNTRQHGCSVAGATGYMRNVAWKNTNHLLAIEGYDGVKTGTTSAAGACLVSSGKRGDRQLIVVVLGSGTSEGRYVDTRNLFQWAWRKPQE